ncbi:UNVERIFIED_CONTAM: hypothetical protein HDU68_007692 [Siphonaria sp. JEL0065]|nr:hypothetical protein HDU68_007692 [Siphonaria sp. JEL0065]
MDCRIDYNLDRYIQLIDNEHNAEVTKLKSHILQLESQLNASATPSITHATHHTTNIHKEHERTITSLQYQLETTNKNHAAQQESLKSERDHDRKEYQHSIAKLQETLAATKRDQAVQLETNNRNHLYELNIVKSNMRLKCEEYKSTITSLKTKFTETVRNHELEMMALRSRLQEMYGTRIDVLPKHLNAIMAAVDADSNEVSVESGRMESCQAAVTSLIEPCQEVSTRLGGDVGIAIMTSPNDSHGVGNSGRDFSLHDADSDNESEYSVVVEHPISAEYESLTPNSSPLLLPTSSPAKVGVNHLGPFPLCVIKTCPKFGKTVLGFEEYVKKACQTHPTTEVGDGDNFGSGDNQFHCSTCNKFVSTQESLFKRHIKFCTPETATTMALPTSEHHHNQQEQSIPWPRVLHSHNLSCGVWKANGERTIRQHASQFQSEFNLVKGFGLEFDVPGSLEGRFLEVMRPVVEANREEEEAGGENANEEAEEKEEEEEEEDREQGEYKCERESCPSFGKDYKSAKLFGMHRHNCHSETMNISFNGNAQSIQIRRDLNGLFTCPCQNMSSFYKTSMTRHALKCAGGVTTAEVDELLELQPQVQAQRQNWVEEDDDNEEVEVQEKQHEKRDATEDEEDVSSNIHKDRKQDTPETNDSDFENSNDAFKCKWRVCQNFGKSFGTSKRLKNHEDDYHSETTYFRLNGSNQSIRIPRDAQGQLTCLCRKLTTSCKSSMRKHVLNCISIPVDLATVTYRRVLHSRLPEREEGNVNTQDKKEENEGGEEEGDNCETDDFGGGSNEGPPISSRSTNRNVIPKPRPAASMEALNLLVIVQTRLPTRSVVPLASPSSNLSSDCTLRDDEHDKQPAKRQKLLEESLVFPSAGSFSSPFSQPLLVDTFDSEAVIADILPIYTTLPADYKHAISAGVKKFLELEKVKVEEEVQETYTIPLELVGSFRIWLIARLSVLFPGEVFFLMFVRPDPKRLVRLQESEIERLKDEVSRLKSQLNVSLADTPQCHHKEYEATVASLQSQIEATKRTHATQIASLKLERDHDRKEYEYKLAETLDAAKRDHASGMNSLRKQLKRHYDETIAALRTQVVTVAKRTLSPSQLESTQNHTPMQRDQSMKDFTRCSPTNVGAI